MHSTSTFQENFIFDNLNDAIVLHDNSGAIEYINESASRILDIVVDQNVNFEAFKKTWTTIREDGTEFPPNEHPAYITIATGEVIQGIVMGIKYLDGGDIKWIEIKSFPYQRDGERKALVIFKEITDLKNKEEDLRDVKVHFKDINDAIYKGALVCCTDLQGKIIEVNDHFRKATGFSEKDLLHSDFSIIRSEYHSQRFFKNLWETILSGKVWKGLICNVNKKGKRYWQDSTIAPIKDSNGQFVKYILIGYDVTDRIESERKLKASNRFLYLEEEISQTGSYRYDLINNEIEYSPQFLKMFGLPSHYKGSFEDLADYVVYEDLPAFYKLIKHQQNFYQFPTEIEFRILPEYSDSPVWISHTSRILPDNSGVFLGAIKDITNKKLYIQELKAQNERLNLATETAGVGFWEWDLNLNELYWDEFMFRLFNVNANIKPSLDLILGLVLPEYKDMIREGINSISKKQGHVNFKYLIKTPTDEIKWIYSSARSFSDEENGISRIIGVTQDITHLEDQKIKLVEAESIAQMGSYEYDFISGAYTYSDGLAALLNIEKEGSITSKKYVETIVHADWKKFYKEGINEFLANNQKHGELTYKIRQNENRPERWVFEKFQVVYDEKKEPVKSLGILLDITERKRAEDRMLHDLKEKEELIREIHHRVKNNLQMISSMMHLKLMNAEESLLRNFIEDTDKRIRSISLLHEKLLVDVSYKNLDIAAYLNDLCNDIMASFHDDRNIEIKSHIEPIQFSTDVVSILGLITTEIIVNSIKHAFEGVKKAKIYLYLKNIEDNQYCYELGDNGIGMNEERKKDEKGFGRNLISVFVKQINGTLEVKNEGGLVYKIIFSV